MIINRFKSGAASNSLLLLGISVVTTVLSLVITKLLSVNFSLSVYGTYSQALLISNTAKSATLLGLTSACNYFYNSTSEEYEQRKFISLIVYIEVIIGIVCATSIVLSRHGISAYYNNYDLNSFLLLVALTPLLENVASIYQTLFVSIGKAKIIAIRNFTLSMCKLIGALVACYFFVDIRITLLILLLIDIVQVFYFATTFNRLKRFVPLRDINKTDLIQVLSFSIPMFLYTVTGTLSNDLDKYIISFFCDQEIFAIYSNASKRLPIELVTTSFLTILAPIITRQINNGNKPEAQKLFKQYLRIGYLSTFIIGGGAIALSNSLIQFMYDKKYIPGESVFIIYILVEMIRFANATIVLTASGKTKIIMYSSIIMLIMNLFLNVPFFYVFGIIGPALCTLILSIVYSLLLLAYGAKLLSTKLRYLFDVKEIILLFFEIMVLGTIIRNVHFLLSDYVNLYVSMILLYLLYLAILFVANRKVILNCLKFINLYK